MKDQKTENVRTAGGNAKRETRSDTPFKGPVSRPTTLRIAPVDAPTRHEMVAKAAYYAAERRGFAAGSQLEDWLLAERQIDADSK